MIEAGNFDHLKPLIDSHPDYIVSFNEIVKRVNNWDEAWYSLVYCILAGTQISSETAKKSYQKLISDCSKNIHFVDIIKNKRVSYKKILSTLKKSGYRFYSTKSKVIVDSADIFPFLCRKNIEEINPYEIRELLANNINGVGYKIATHWLRNIGFQFPIIDIHVRRILVRCNFIEQKFTKNNLTRKEYLSIEDEMFRISKELNIPAGLLDYILWKHGADKCFCP